MAFELKPYQEQAATEVVLELRDAQRVYARRQKLTAVGLSAPTGAGKTVIATSVLERLLLGDSEHDPIGDLTVLWVTDDPALNRQTINKMLAASHRFTDDDFIEIDAGFDQRTLERGRIHFAHIHLFGRGTTSMQKSNSREYGLWEIVANSVARFGENLLLVRDEAHRGTEGSKKDVPSIIARLTHGGSSDHFSGHVQPAMPVVFGISATIDKFRKEMAGQRSLEEVPVPVTEVRESGLLKDRIIVKYPGEHQPAEYTLLETAIDRLRAADAAWTEHSEDTGTARVEPLLVVQVSPDAGDEDKRLAGYLSVLERKWSALKGGAVAHSFDSHATKRVGDKEIRYVAPDRIAADNRVRVVFFKNALTTGWDCPRAEVMLSFRNAKDYTNIAQLIGRMVRTPQGVRIEGKHADALNAVTLYLPRYDKNSVAQVIAALTDDTDGDIDITLDPVDAVKAKGEKVDQAFALLSRLPSDVRNTKAFKSETDRLLGLARLLRRYRVLDDAGSQARTRLVGAIATEARVHAAELDRLSQDVVTLDVSQTVYDYRRGVTKSDEPADVVHAGHHDIDAQFAAAVRVLPDATGKWYWNDLCDHMDPDEAKVRVASLVKTPEMASILVSAVEYAATAQVEAWRVKFENEIATKGRDVRREFDMVWAAHRGTHVADIVVPDTYVAASEVVDRKAEPPVAKPVDVFDKHLYVTPPGHRVVGAGKFPFAPGSSWERDVVRKETSIPSLVGWYRNPPRSQHGLGIAYEDGDKPGLMYPDFMFFHEDGPEVVLDIVDPHQHNQSDTGPKWAGLARWAERNNELVRRVVAVIKTDTTLRALDLTKDGVVERLDSCRGRSDIEKVFDDLGSNY